LLFFNDNKIFQGNLLFSIFGEIIYELPFLEGFIVKNLYFFQFTTKLFQSSFIKNNLSQLDIVNISPFTYLDISLKDNFVLFLLAIKDKLFEKTKLFSLKISKNLYTFSQGQVVFQASLCQTIGDKESFTI